LKFRRPAGLHPAGAPPNTNLFEFGRGAQ
jgi:hypothetical protein